MSLIALELALVARFRSWLDSRLFSITMYQ